MEITINLPGESKVVRANSGDSLLDIIRDSGININAPCNGSGTCGKCKVKLVRGKVEVKKGHKLSDENNGYILACGATVVEPLEIVVPKESILDVVNIKIENKTTEQFAKYYDIKESFEGIHGFEKHLRTIDINLDLPTIDDNISDLTRLKKYVKLKLGIENVEVNVNILRKLPTVLRKNDFKLTVIYSMKEDAVKLVDVRTQGDYKMYGVAVDIGTTSISALLVDLMDDTILGEVSCANAQSKYGADVINRIIFATKGNGLNILQKALVEESINPLIVELCNMNHISNEEILLFAASANTTMVHLLLGVYPDEIRKEPYIPAITQTEDLSITPGDIKLAVNKNAEIIVSSSIASYVGGDISAGVIACNMRENEENSILIDLGTNGEIVFGNKDFLMTCACSAGPAFEGGGISCGMRAAHGAIEAVHIDPVSFIPNLVIIDSYRPYGICGSGIIDLISELKRVGLIDARGKFIKDKNCSRVKYDQYGVGSYIVAYKKEYGIEDNIYITEIDIDSFIRTKAAVYSATYVLLSSLGMDFDQVEKIFVAGGIGSHINMESAINIGLLPEIDQSKYHFIGNSSLTGSYMSLINKRAKEYTDDTAEHMTYLELSVYPGYMDEFISASFIPHTDFSRFPSHR